MPHWLARALSRLRRWGRPAPIPDTLWAATLARHRFLARLSADEQARLRRLATFFLAQKQFTGAHGLPVTDAMAVAVAAQACLPLIHLGAPGRPETALALYGDFVTIVLQPGEAIAPRETVDAAGVVHRYTELLAGEAMHGGPVMLSWPDVARADTLAEAGSNVVIHEFAHKIDMHAGPADGCPPLPAGFMGAPHRAAAHAHWQHLWQTAYQQFCDRVSLAERFGAPAPWLDAYAAHSPPEFFAVACEAHFTAPERFAAEHPTLAQALRAVFRQPALTAAP
ncbi:MAG: zinc-dependent peptidase [Comamonadaceae bacterium]|nr:zinc-dependent peptidase [Comamonadaceae bacterium]